MKNSKYFIALIIVLILFGVALETMSDTLSLQSRAQIQTPKFKEVKHKKSYASVEYSCPDNWHISEGSFVSGMLTICMPNIPKAPKQINCPPDTQPIVETSMMGCTPIEESMQIS